MIRGIGWAVGGLFGLVVTVIVLALGWSAVVDGQGESGVGRAG